MKKTLLFLTLFLAIIIHSFSQNRFIARGAEPGELYLTGAWYGIYNPVWGPPIYDTLRTALYRLTENGKKITIQYDADYFANPENVMQQPDYILADATPGVLYTRNTYSKNYYTYTSLWVSFDYGENWIFREEGIGLRGYYAANVEGLIYRAYYVFYKSLDYGYTFSDTVNGPGGSEPGLQNGEGFSLRYVSNRLLLYSYDFGETFIENPIDEQYIFGSMSGISPDVYRGGLSGEVYISSWFPDWSYKVSFSADTGRTFRHVYVCENSSPYTSENVMTSFMSDREPGVFYIIRRYEVEDTNPWGWHVKVCVDYYKDYGEILEATFCHDLIKNYEYEEAFCTNTTFLESETVNQNSVRLHWSNSAINSFIRGYHVFRNNTRITNQLLTETTYLDENLPDGAYEYYVRSYYIESCVSDSSNHTRETIELGIKEVENVDGIVLYPNPTTGELRIKSYELRIEGIEIFDVFGRKQKAEHRRQNEINISELKAGVYFVRITTEKGTITKKIVKQ